ncbi:MAG: trans-2,3-dihydro-3-hydroxyanthranilate isomerase [Gaiellaceae bacterium]|nr:trans-2,3-dihydro-3-hydroxyanthranilate isomerase [Gaiellaceae bacterium]
MPTYRYVLADVFTDTPLEGNQLAVFTDGRGISDETMQRIAREMNLSETVFVLRPEQGGSARIRIFTPAAELQFAGHPTLGSAFVLAGPLQADEILLETGAGVVSVVLEREAGRIVFGRMAQPVPTWEPLAQPEELLAALGVTRSELPVEVYDNGVQHIYVAVPTVAELVALRPDLGAVERIAGRRGSVCFSGAGASWKVRMFDPGLGIAEDPATGSAAGPLAVHLARHGRIDFGTELEISQGVEIGRPSTLFARAEGSAGAIGRVEVGGSAVIVARGEFRLPD